MSTFVYFVKIKGMDGPVKIGCSWSPEGRLEALMSWSPFPLEIIVKIDGDESLERRLHGIFASSHSHGEWFHASKRLSSLISELQAGKPISALINLNGRILPFRKRKSKRTPSQRLQFSYSQRIRHAYKSVWRPDKTSRYVPRDAQEILDNWQKACRKDANAFPVQDAIARLEEVIKNPELYAQTVTEAFGADDEAA